MPFTFAHPLAVLPLLKKRYFSATGLIAGSIAPDFESFLRMKSSNEHSHTITGMFYFDLPLSLVIAILFQLVLKESLIANSPGFMQKRLAELRQLDFWNYLKRNYWIVLYSALVGSATHLVWDSFTHGGGALAKQIPLMMTTKVPFQGAHYPLWYTLQNISSILGLSIVLIYVFRLKPHVVQVSKPSWFFWLILPTVTSAAFYLRYTFGEIMSFGNTVVALVSAFLAGLLITALLFRFLPFPKRNNNFQHS